VFHRRFSAMGASARVGRGTANSWALKAAENTPRSTAQRLLEFFHGKVKLNGLLLVLPTVDTIDRSPD
jgi:hypothetical protein